MMLRRVPSASAPFLAMLTLGALVTAAPCVAQQPAVADTIVGRVFAPDSTPIANARVRVEAGAGTVIETATDANGRYRLIVPGRRGEYSVAATALGYVSFTGIALRSAPAGAVARDLRLTARVIMLAPVVARAPGISLDTRKRTPGERFEEFSALAGERLPVSPGDLTELAALTPGVVRVGPGGDGAASLSIAGQAPEQNRTTVDGASYGGSTLPAEGLRSVATVVNTYDVSLGQFSGGEVAARSAASRGGTAAGRAGRRT